jgi:glycosyltransferase involved in cell wall biosynthesis
MKTDILIIQRFFYNFREGFFDFLNEKKVDFQLINRTRSLGRVTVHDSFKNKPYIKPIPSFSIGKNYAIFPFLFFHILFLKPRWIVAEGGQNTINNLHVLIYHLITGKKYIIWDLGKGYMEFNKNLLRNIYLYFYKLTLRNAAYIYTYNSSGIQYFQSLGMDINKVHVLNNTVDTRKLKQFREMKPMKKPDELANNINTNQIYFIFVGTLLPSKRIEDLKDLLDLLGDRYSLIIVGDGERAYRDQLHKLFGNNNCTFVGYKKPDELAPYYLPASFAILPGLGGLSINQAMAFGLPVLCRNADGAEKDLVTDNETGYIFTSLEDAARFIKSKSKQDWQRMGKNSEKLIYTEHSLDSMAERFLSKLHS